MLTRTAEMSIADGKNFTASDLVEFATQVPGDAVVTITEQRGDQRDPREAGYRKVTIKARWTE